VRVYGDPSGTAAKTTGPSDHQVVRQILGGFNVVWCIPSRAPHVRDRVSAVNARCETMDGKHHFRLDPSCKHLQADLEQVTFANNGELDKTSNELRTHISDALGYWIVKEFPAVSTNRGGAMFVDWIS
jgi:hypothetical protein